MKSDPRPVDRCARITAKDGTITVVMLVMLLLMFVFGFILLDFWKEAVLKRQGTAIAEAVALEALRLKHLPEYNPPGYIPYSAGNLLAPDIWPRIQWIARKNGLGGLWFDPLDFGDIEQGANWVTVTVTTKDGDLDPISATAVGFPTWTVGEGDEWFVDDAYTEVEGVTGVLPIGIQSNTLTNPTIVPPEAWTGGATFFVRVAVGLAQDAQPLGLPGGLATPLGHLEYLDIDPPPNNPFPLNGTPPPTLRVGDEVVIAYPRVGPPGQQGQNWDPGLEDFSDYMTNLIGRVVIVPLLNDYTVVDFLLLRIEDAAKVVTSNDGGNAPPGQTGQTPPPNPGQGGTPPGQGGTVPGLGPGVFIGAVDVTFRFMPSRVVRSTYRHPDQPLVNPFLTETWGRVLRPSIWPRMN